MAIVLCNTKDFSSNGIKVLVYGQSVTDACIDWDDSVKVLKTLADAVKRRRAVKQFKHGK